MIRAAAGKLPLGRVRSFGIVAETIVMLLLIAGLGATLLVIGNANPWTSYDELFKGAFGSRDVFGETLLRFAPLALIATALTPSLRAGLFNIGALGQIGMGGLASTMFSLHAGGLPRWLLLLGAAAAAAAAGALWCLVPALLRAYMRVNEILSTLVFNFFALGLLSYLLRGPLKGDLVNIPESDQIPAKADLPILLSGTRAHIGVIVALVAIVVLAVYGRTPAGYRIRLYSGSPGLARRAGVTEPRLIVGSMCLGAAGAGLAGWMQVAGVDQRLYDTVAAPIGYTALFVALLGNLNPIGILIASFFFGALLRGGESLQVAAGVSPEISNALIGVIILAVATHAGHRARRVSNTP